MNELENNEWLRRYDEFHAAHPECPIAEDIKSLNLVMKRNYAEDIKNGKKRVEFRAYSAHYCERLFDKDVDKYIQMHADEETDNAIKECFISPLRIVRNLHFHNYNNTWTLDVECVENGIIALVPEDVQMLQEQFDCHELDEQLEMAERRRDKQRPLLFYFVCGEVKDAKGI